MIQFHKRLRPVKVISFDLDDTLYDNLPVMQKAEQSLVEYLHTHHPQTRPLGLTGWRALRNKLAASDENLASNMTALRLATLQHGLQQHGLNERQSGAASEDAMQYFLQHRNAVDVAPEVRDLLAALQQHYPLIAISNGNVDINRIGLADYFSHVWQPTSHLRGKPASDMFVAAQGKSGFAAHELLHVGDHPVSDIQGAANFGAQSVWLNDCWNDHRHGVRGLTWLPTVTITSLPQLADILL